MHFEQGRDYRRAVQYLRQAAENAARRYANREVVSYLTRALGLMERLPAEERVRLQMAVLEQCGLVRRAMGNMKRAAEDFAALAACARQQGQSNGEVKALLYLASALAWVDLEQSLAVAEQAVALSRHLQDELLQAHTRSLYGYWRSLVHGWREEDAQGAAPVEMARQADDHVLLSVHLADTPTFSASGQPTERRAMQRRKDCAWRRWAVMHPTINLSNLPILGLAAPRAVGRRWCAFSRMEWRWRKRMGITYK